jgi:hypothetical protein
MNLGRLLTAIAATATALAGCQQDVRLGDHLSDDPFMAIHGEYRLDHRPLTAITCGGALAGKEDSLLGVTPETVGLFDGDVLVEPGEGGVLVCGMAIENGYRVDDVLLQYRPVPPPALCLAGTVIRSDPGPLGTRAIVAGLALSQHISATGELIGESSVAFELFEPDGEGGRCTVTFAVLLTGV